MPFGRHFEKLLMCLSRIYSPFQSWLIGTATDIGAFCLFVYSFIHLFIHLFIYSFIYLFYRFIVRYRTFHYSSGNNAKKKIETAQLYCRKQRHGLMVNVSREEIPMVKSK